MSAQTRGPAYGDRTAECLEDVDRTPMAQARLNGGVA